MVGRNPLKVVISVRIPDDQHLVFHSFVLKVLFKIVNPLDNIYMKSKSITIKLGGRLFNNNRSTLK